MSVPDDEGPVAVLDPEAERALARTLRAAWAPEPIEPMTHERILELALTDPLAPASDAELVESARLREALEGRGEHAGARLAGALRAAAAPKDPGHATLERAQARVGAGAGRRNVFYVAFGAVAAAAALAASAALVLRPAPGREPRATLEPAAPLVQSRSTAPLFAEKFEPGRSSERIERIASARERDLRANRYALWGVR